MNIKKLNTLNSSNFSNFSNPKIIKSYDDTPKDTSLPKAESPISFAKSDDSGLSFAIPEAITTEATEAPDKSQAERRAERRNEWKQAADVQRRAMNMQKEAEEKIKEADQIKKLLEEAKKDPTAIARALNESPTDYLKRYQNQMFEIPNEVPLSPEQEVKQRLEKYEDERKKEREQFQELQSLTIKQNYISNKILPVLMSDKDKFEILNNNDPNLSAAFIYDIMNEHFTKTGEELSANDVAEEMENILFKEIESKLASTRKYKKLSKYFKEEEQLGEDLQETAAPSQLGGISKAITRKAVDFIPERTNAEGFNQNSSQKSTSFMSKKEKRLKDLENMLRSK